MNKTTMTAMACLAAGSLFASVPVVNPGSVSMSQDASRKVTITYRLSGEPGIVTIDIQTNYVDGTETKWATIGGKNISHLYGDVNRINTNVSSDSHAYWRPDKSWKEGGKIEDGGVRAVVTAWATNAPPDYMVVDLQIKGGLFFYADAESIPGGVQDRQYKTTKMIMRKVPAAGVIWRMGAPTTEKDRGKGKDWPVFEPARLVVLSEDYYMGIYEVTIGQWNTACDTSGNTWVKTQPENVYSGPDADVFPLTASWWCFRADLSDSRRYPDKGRIVPAAYGLGSFQGATGLALDFPTSAQWEYACRAGSGERFCFGADANDLADYAWYSDNAEGTIHEVGKLKPNAWGLYDVHGNVAEWLVEEAYYPNASDPTTPVIDPTVPLGGTGSTRFSAGGSFSEVLGYQRCAARLNSSDRNEKTQCGARLWAPAVVSY